MNLASAAMLLAVASPLGARIDAALAAPALAGAHVGMLAVDAASGRTLYEHLAGEDFVPASTLKLIVGSAALARLGPAFPFDTSVAIEGHMVGDELRGDVVLRGGGDVELSGADLDAAASALAARGIRRVDGRLIADDSAFRAPRVPPGWNVDDLPYGYAAVPGALGMDLNVAHARVAPGASVGAPARLMAEPNASMLLENAAVTGPPGSEDTSDLERPWDRPTTVRVTGSYPWGAGVSDDLEPAMPDPAAFTLDAFARALTRAHVAVLGAREVVRSPLPAAPDGEQTVWVHHSKPLSELLRDFWPPSVNVIGEELLFALGANDAVAADAALDTRARGLAVERQWLSSIGVDPATLTLVDGSGLSEYDRATPRALVAVLQNDWHGPQRESVLAALPVAGRTGTLASTFAGTPLAGAVAAKTGSMNHARLLAGYLRRPSGETVTFALMVDDWVDASPGAAKALDAARAQILSPLLDGDDASGTAPAAF